ncbi:hypothetical protein G3I16_12485 [Streptomyces sp. SID11726]|nr:hypothetical protein [Streptomyces sp. SID11726]NDZ94918.1 hypothetical protein [Streptomyces sp. SID11726]
MSKKKQNLFTFVVWWLMYHGDENPFAIWKEVARKGYHDCHDCLHPLHRKNRRDF